MSHTLTSGYGTKGALDACLSAARDHATSYGTVPSLWRVDHRTGSEWHAVAVDAWGTRMHVQSYMIPVA